MYLIPIACVVGAIVGTAVSLGRHRTLRGVGRLSIAYWPVLVLALVASAAIGIGRDLPGGAAWLVAAIFLGGAVCMLNLHVPGTGIVLIGLGMNLLAIALNGHIAVDPAALVDAGVVGWADLELVRLGTGRALQTSDTLLPVLGAVVPIDPADEVLSFGDLVLMAGLANVGFRVMMPRSVPTPPPTVRASQPTSADRATIDIREVVHHHDAPVGPPAATISGEAEYPPRTQP